MLLQALAMSLGLGVAVAVGLTVFADGALDLMGAGPDATDIHRLAKQFLLIRSGLGLGDQSHLNARFACAHIRRSSCVRRSQGIFSS